MLNQSENITKTTAPYPFENMVIEESKQIEIGNDYIVKSINGIIISIRPDPELLISSIIRVYHPPLARVVVELRKK